MTPSNQYNIGECCYDYTDENGMFLFQVLRLHPKKFYQRRLEKGKWVYNLNGIRKVLYRLPDVIEAEKVFVVEGEKDADFLLYFLHEHLKKAGYTDPTITTVTTCSGGSGAWKEEYNKYFNNKEVYIIPDNDKPGLKLANNVACGIFQESRSVKIILLPNLHEGGDISDWLSGGHSIDDLLSLCSSTRALNEQDVLSMKPKTNYNLCPSSWPDLGYHRGINSKMIRIALQYPISELIDVDASSKAYCISPDHKDEHRSMDTRRNFMFCYGCGYHGDVIRLAQFLWKCNFPTAVKKLHKLSFQLKGRDGKENSSTNRQNSV